MNFGDTRIDGNPALMLWFHGLTQDRRADRLDAPAAPAGARADPHARARRAVGAAGSSASPRSASSAATGREAWAAREKLLQIRAAAGERLPPG